MLDHRKVKKKSRVSLIFLLLFLVLFLNVFQKSLQLHQNSYFNKNSIGSQPVSNFPCSAISYVNSSSIKINGDAYFQTQANDNNWTGNGTISNPYLISDLQITSHSSDITLILIANTTVAFSIQEDWLSGGMVGIILENTTNGVIKDNMIQSCSDDGIEILQSPQISIMNNTITKIQGSEVQSGIYTSQSDQLLIENNTITSNTIGIWVDGCTNCSVIANQAGNNEIYGIYTTNQGGNNYSRNDAYDNSLAGMRFLHAGNDFIGLNNLSFNGDGISISGNDAGHNLLMQNYAFNNTAIGIDLESTIDNTVFNNTVNL